MADVDSNTEVIEEIPSGPLTALTKAEIRNPIISMSAGKAPGVDGIAVELVKADMAVPADWRKGLNYRQARQIRRSH